MDFFTPGAWFWTEHRVRKVPRAASVCCASKHLLSDLSQTHYQRSVASIVAHAKASQNIQGPKTQRYASKVAPRWAPISKHLDFVRAHSRGSREVRRGLGSVRPDWGPFL